MKSTLPPTDPHALGRDVFLSAETAVVDDFTRVSDAHLDAAIGYGEVQLILPKRSKQVLRLLKAEKRNRATARRLWSRIN